MGVSQSVQVSGSLGITTGGDDTVSAAKALAGPLESDASTGSGCKNGFHGVQYTDIQKYADSLVRGAQGLLEHVEDQFAALLVAVLGTTVASSLDQLIGGVEPDLVVARLEAFPVEWLDQ